MDIYVKFGCLCWTFQGLCPSSEDTLGTLMDKFGPIWDKSGHVQGSVWTKLGQDMDKLDSGGHVQEYVRTRLGQSETLVDMSKGLSGQD